MPILDPDHDADLGTLGLDPAPDHRQIAFVRRLRVTGKVLRRLDCFHPRVDIPLFNITDFVYIYICKVKVGSRHGN